MTYDVTDRLTFAIDGADQGFVVYDGIVRNRDNTAWRSLPAFVGVQFSEAGDGTISASLQNNFVWFTNDGWNFDSADQEGKRGYFLQGNLFATFIEGRLVSLEAQDQFGQYVPSLQQEPPSFSLIDGTVSRNTLTGTVTETTVIPVPPALTLLASALFGLGLLHRRRRAGV